MEGLQEVDVYMEFEFGPHDGDRPKMSVSPVSYTHLTLPTNREV